MTQEGTVGGACKIKNVLRKVQKVKLHKACHFIEVKVLAWKVKSQHFTKANEKSQTFVERVNQEKINNVQVKVKKLIL